MQWEGRFEHYKYAWLCRGWVWERNVPPPALSAKIFANGAQRLVKAPFLDFSWGRNAKMV